MSNKKNASTAATTLKNSHPVNQYSTHISELQEQRQLSIPFNVPTVTGLEQPYLNKVFANNKYSGGGFFNQQCNDWFEQNLGALAALTTTSCTHALEMAALLCDLSPGDEVILPSYAFSSTATAFVRCGARLVFVDVDPITMNLDSKAVQKAISPRTKVIVALHYAGVACEMSILTEIAKQYNLLVVEDAAQALFSEYQGKPCGTLGTFGCFSFHETKNLQCGEGGALLINDSVYIERAEVLLEKGTNRRNFFRGHVDKYTWVDIGSSYVPSELSSAFLLAQLEQGHEITDNRLQSWHEYHRLLMPLALQGCIEIPAIPPACSHNGHIFWIKTKSLEERTSLSSFLKKRGVHSVFHYIPLHTAPAGRRYGYFHGEDYYTTSHSERLLRLPLYYNFKYADIVASAIYEFYQH